MDDARIGSGHPEAGVSAPGRRPAAGWATLAGVLLLVAAGALAPLFRAWLAGLTILHRDQTGQFAPLRWLAGAALREGRLPLWNPFCATGMPFLADLTHGVLHPLSVASAFLFPSDSIEPLAGAWVAAAAVGTAVLVRSLGASRTACLVAGLGAGLAGWTLSMTSNLIGAAGAGSAPWVVAGLREAGRGRGAAGYLAASLAVAAGALAGDVQALAVATAVGLALAVEAGGWRGAAAALGGVLTGALLGGIQLLPAWRLLPNTDRILPPSPDDAAQWDLAPWRLVELLSPGFFTRPGDGMGPAPVFVALGHPTIHQLPLAESVFLGAALLLLAAAGVGASRAGRVLLGAAAAVLWLALGRHLGARALQDLVPVAGQWRYGEKYLTNLVPLVAALAALGTDRLRADAAAARRWAVGACGSSALLAAAWLALLPGAGGGLLARLGAPEAARLQDHLRGGLLHAVLALAAVAGFLWLAGRGRGAVAAAGLAATVWVAGAAASPFALRPGQPEPRLHARPLPLSAPALAPGPRIYQVGAMPDRKPRPGWNSIDERNLDVHLTYAPNTNALLRVDAFGVDAGLQPFRWAALVEAAGPTGGKVARRFAVTHIATRPGPIPPGSWLGPVTAGGAAVLVEPRDGAVFWAVPHRPWASFPREVVSVNGAASALVLLERLEREESRSAVVEADGILPVAPGKVLRVSRGLERLEIEAEAQGESVLVVNDAWWPGWRAEVDGREVPIFPADYLVRAVPWPAGRHILVMRYDPPEVGHGKVLSLAGALALASGVALLRRRRGAEAR